jgi:hypothetical protein
MKVREPWSENRYAGRGTMDAASMSPLIWQRRLTQLDFGVSRRTLILIQNDTKPRHLNTKHLPLRCSTPHDQHEAVQAIAITIVAGQLRPDRKVLTFADTVSPRMSVYNHIRT